MSEVNFSSCGIETQVNIIGEGSKTTVDVSGVPKVFGDLRFFVKASNGDVSIGSLSDHKIRDLEICLECNNTTVSFPPNPIHPYLSRFCISIKGNNNNLVIPIGSIINLPKPLVEIVGNGNNVDVFPTTMESTFISTINGKHNRVCIYSNPRVEDYEDDISCNGIGNEVLLANYGIRKRAN